MSSSITQCIYVMSYPLLSLVPSVSKMDRKAGKEAEEFMSSVFPAGITAATATKRPAAGGAAAAKKTKVDPADMDVKKLAQSGEVSGQL